MPTYEYACDACKHTFEEFQSIKAAPISTCPKCKKKKVKRLISGGAGFLFKGSGFYITDYRSDSYKSAAKSDTAKPESKTESKSETKSESKPAASESKSSSSGTKSHGKK